VFRDRIFFMRFSKLFCPTQKNAPREAEIISHKLMLRSGMIAKEASGIYTYLPLGYKILRKLENIIRNELNKSGAQEVHMPMVSTSALWKETGRWEKYGKELLRFEDRHGNEFCLGPTHEEVVTDLIRNHIHSYKQLPLNVYQIQTKFRDEVRPRFGLMRGREFYMKDAYSFDCDKESLDATYTKMIETYERIFSACGLNFRRVEADNGSIGGSQSSEFMVLANTGEDTIIECDEVNYSANDEVHEDKKFQKKYPQIPLSALKRWKGIEVGHVFKLGTTYSKAMNATFTDKQGVLKPFEMGCYGIGVSRTVAAAIEQNHDDKGIIWTEALAPFEAVIIASGDKISSVKKAAEDIYYSFLEKERDVLFDDRPCSIGVKFKDADLIGIPIQIIFGKNWANEEKVEVKHRKNSHVELMSLEAVKQRFLDKKL